jgi:NADH-quinone oxidoreductase subunit J
MTTDLIVFLILALIAIATALGMMFSRNAIYAALYLVLNFVTVAIFYLMLGAPFVALSQVTVYAGAIMVLFLFVIMLLGTEKIPPTEVLPWQRPTAIGLAALLFLEAAYWFAFKAGTTAEIAAPEAALGTMETVRTMSELLFTDYLLPFEVTSILLLVAMIGAIVLTHKEKKGGQA